MIKPITYRRGWVIAECTWTREEDGNVEDYRILDLIEYPTQQACQQAIDERRYTND